MTKEEVLKLAEEAYDAFQAKGGTEPDFMVMGMSDSVTFWTGVKNENEIVLCKARQVVTQIAYQISILKLAEHD